MAIKFGDILQNQNTDYPIVDASGNDLKGVLFGTALPGDSDYPNKRALGTIFVDTAADKMYFYKGADTTDSNWGDSDNWEVLATGSGETIQTDDIAVSIPSGLSFGRFENGDTISVGSGKSAVQIILDALTSFIEPEGQFAGSTTDVEYRTTSQSVTHSVSFSVTNNNQAVVAGTAADSAYAIREIKLWRKLGSGTYTEIANATASVNDFATGTFDDLNTQGAVTAETFSFSDTISVASGSADFTYKVEIIPNDGDGVATDSEEFVGADGNSGFIECAAYVHPTLNSDSVTRQDTSSHFVGTAETTGVREKGNIASKLDFKVKCNSPGVPVTGYNVKRSINGGTAVTIMSVTGLSLTGTSSTYKLFDSVATSANNVTGLDNTPSGYTDVTSAWPTGQISANTVKYTIEILDGQTGNSTDTFNVAGISDELIDFEFPGLIGYSTEGGTNNDPSTLTDQQLSDEINDIRSGSSVNRIQYEILNTTASGEPDFGSVTMTPNGSQFTYIAFPSSYSEIDTVTIPGSVPEYGAFGSDPRSTSVSFTTHYGITSSAYEVYVSNSAGAFNGTYNIN